ncbi:AraC family transcriptional regulator [Paenibacillus sp. BK720]|uniref:AraC family transcriptional regulator n=1 Tax=Paenibacillus sp. BK720 TaxID=2587092 RepID=UPI001422DDD3|nr:AraC family transcriptional regulator [Paenibacillus sp. BK720]NIK69530.1 AraC-like DNA-binding protein/mannose-6-phosphate isomerase-like protein (cupin superfamily) [Paenibacillus sp. BK720]
MEQKDRQKKEYMLPDMDSTFRVFGAHSRTVEPDWSYPLHKHPMFEINLVLTGTQQFSVERTSYTQQAGDLLLFRPGDQHESRVSGEGDMTYYCLHFDVDEPSFRELLNRSPRCFYPADSELSVAIRPALNKLIGLTVSQEAVLRTEARMHVLSALFELFAALSGTLSKLNQDPPGLRSSELASRVAVMLEEALDGTASPGHLNDKDTITSIAAAVGYSTSSVNRLFTRSFGVSPRQYLSTIMLRKAKLMLMDPELSVEEISARLGYNNIAHFSRQFKRWTGESPSRFRDRFHD